MPALVVKLEVLNAVGPRVKAAREKLPKVNIAGLLRRRTVQEASLHDEVDACDTSADTMQRAFCMGAYDPLSNTSTGWVLRGTKVAQGARANLRKVNWPPNSN